MWRCRLLLELYTYFENQGASKNIKGEASGDRIYRIGHAQYCMDSEETNRTLSPHLGCIDVPWTIDEEAQQSFIVSRLVFQSTERLPYEGVLTSTLQGLSGPQQP